MITLYSKATSNGRKASIMLEESGLDYTVRPMALGVHWQIRCRDAGEEHAHLGGST